MPASPAPLNTASAHPFSPPNPLHLHRLPASQTNLQRCRRRPRHLPCNYAVQMSVQSGAGIVKRKAKAAQLELECTAGGSGGALNKKGKPDQKPKVRSVPTQQ